jgi:hypothetical protein
MLFISLFVALTIYPLWESKATGILNFRSVTSDENSKKTNSEDITKSLELKISEDQKAVPTIFQAGKIFNMALLDSFLDSSLLDDSVKVKKIPFWIQGTWASRNEVKDLFVLYPDYVCNLTVTTDSERLDKFGIFRDENQQAYETSSGGDTEILTEGKQDIYRIILKRDFQYGFGSFRIKELAVKITVDHGSSLIKQSQWEVSEKLYKPTIMSSQINASVWRKTYDKDGKAFSMSHSNLIQKPINEENSKEITLSSQK